MAIGGNSYHTRAILPTVRSHATTLSFLAMGGALALTVSLAISACGDDYGEDSSSTSSASSSSGSSGAGVDSGSGGPTDSGAATTKESGPFSAPGRVECGDTLVCDLTKEEFCCITNQNGKPGYECIAKGGSCSENKALCDEAADCNGKSCCGTISIGKFETICSTSCNVAQSCRTDAECGSEGCVKQRCTGLVSWLCGKNPFCDAL